MIQINKIVVLFVIKTFFTIYNMKKIVLY